MAVPIIIDLYNAYKSNLFEIGYNTNGGDYMLCPLCLEKISRENIEKKIIPIEHIIPLHSTIDKKQKTPFTKIGVKSVRSGLTITCKTCNEKKGSKLDAPMRNLITPSVKINSDYGDRRTGIAILIYAYLFAFAVWGYEYILKPDLKQIRQQFADIDGNHTNFLNYAEVNLGGNQQPIICNEMGYPFIFGLGEDALQLFFWRFRAMLPAVKGIKTTIHIPESIINLAKYS